MPSIVQFGFMLLESVEEHCNSNDLLGIEELGLQILKTLFEVHDMARNEVGTAVNCRIILVITENALL